MIYHTNRLERTFRDINRERKRLLMNADAPLSIMPADADETAVIAYFAQDIGEDALSRLMRNRGYLEKEIEETVGFLRKGLPREMLEKLQSL
jgi:hypothetical protein